MAGWNAAGAFSQVALHSTPDTLNVVAHAKVSCRVVVGFLRVAKPLDTIVSRNNSNASLLSVGNTLQSSGI